MIRFHPRATIFATALIVATAIAGCGGSQPEPKPPIPPPSVERCPDACEHLRALSCDLAKPTPRGKTCEQLCLNMESNGVRFISCTITAPTCEAADLC